MTKVVIPAAATVDVAIPTNGGILGVYSDSAVTLDWVFNGEEGRIVTGVLVWEPVNPFYPSPFSKLRITAAAAANVTIRTV